MLSINKKSVYKTPMKVLSAFLVFIMVIQLLPMSVFAEEINDESSQIIPSEQEMDIVNEVTNERDEYRKVYELSDGTYYEVNSDLPIHTYVNDEWVEPETDEIDEPRTTKDAIEHCNKLSEDIMSSQSNDDNIISPYSLDITDQNTPDVEYVILSPTGRNNSVLRSNTNLVAKIPNVKIGSANKSQATISCKMLINCQVSQPGKIYAYNIMNDWDINDPNLKLSSIAKSSNIVDFTDINKTDTYSWDITDTYLKWEKGIFDNNGLAFTIKDRCAVTIGGSYITRQYKLIDSYDTDFTYHSIDMGRAGKVYINDFSNTVLLVRDEIGVDGNILPVELYRYFDYGRAYPTVNASGEGARWNYDSKLSKTTSVTFAWEAFDGSTIYFTPTDNSFVFKDSSGIGYTLTLDTQAINNDNFENSTLLSPEGIQYNFNPTGKIKSITDEYDNKIEIHYTTSNDNDIDYIEDGLNRRYYFNYSNENYVYDENGTEKTVRFNTLNSISVKAPIEKDSDIYQTIKIGGVDATVNYEYTLLPNKHIAIAKVIYPDKETVLYSYNDYGYLTQIINTDGRRLVLNYYAEIPYYSSEDNTSISVTYKTVNQYPSLSSYKEEVKNIDEEIINTDISSPDYNEYLEKSSLKIDRHNNYQREFTNESGKTELIQYNPHLKVLYYKNLDGETYYADYTDDELGNDVLSQILSPENASNKVRNNDFENGELYPWYEYDGNSLAVIPESLSNGGECILRTSGTATEMRAAIQDVKVDATAGDIFVIGGWGRANAPISAINHFFGFEVYSCEVDDTFPDEPLVMPAEEPIYRLSFDTTLDYEAQFRLGAFKIPSDTSYLQIRLVYSYQAGSADFDEIQLYKSSEDNVTFFDDTTENEVMPMSEELEETPEDTKTITNSKGLTTAEIMSDGNSSMISKYEYDENYYISNYTDTNNVSTEYSYDASNGILNSTTIGENKTEYAYTPVGALREVKRAVTGLEGNISELKSSYSYSHDRITSITHNNVKYNLTYNSFGNVKKVDIENVSSGNKNDLISYNYSNDYKQNLNSIEYANGDTLIYQYDSNDNISEIYAKSSSDAEATLLYKYEYENNVLAKIIDYSSKRITEFADNTYTISSFTEENGEIISAYVLYTVSKDDTGVKHESMFGNDYTFTEHESTFDELTNETSYSSTSHFDVDNYLIDMNSSSVSDFFGRAKSSKLSVSSVNLDSEAEGLPSHSIENTYTYKNYDTSYSNNGETVNLSATTNLIDTFKTEVVINDDSVDNPEENILNSFYSKYEYDDSGRITHIYYGQNEEDAKLISFYQYDESGQLIAEAKFTEPAKATKYQYDSNGNITLKEWFENADSFSFDNDTLEFNEPTRWMDFNYGNESYSNGCSDFLTSINEIPINYDANGNPLMYFGESLFDYSDDGQSSPPVFNMEWQGSLLKSATNYDGKSKYEYSYDQNGLRTKKSRYVASESGWNLEYEIEYLWDDGLLTGYQIVTPGEEGTGRASIKLIFDEYQSPIGMYVYSDNTAPPETAEPDGSDETVEKLLPDNHNVFWFIKDGQGNIVAIYSEFSKLTVGCNYDAYGNLKLDFSGALLDELAQMIKDCMENSPVLLPLITLITTIVLAGAVASALLMTKLCIADMYMTKKQDCTIVKIDIIHHLGVDL